MAIKIAGSDIISYVKFVVALDKIISNRTRDALTVVRAGVLGKKDWEIGLAGEWLLLEEPDQIIEITVAETNAGGVITSLSGPHALRVGVGEQSVGVLEWVVAGGVRPPGFARGRIVRYAADALGEVIVGPGQVWANVVAEPLESDVVGQSH
jgi:hypothetical protein